MRCAAGAGLLALVGCNQIFGLTPTEPYDASIDVVPDMPHVVLDWQIATLFPAGTPNPGAPDPTIRFLPIDPAPKVRIALLEGSFDKDQTTYSTGDGWIQIPRDYLSTPWRLEYTLAGDVPHEVQWAPDDKQGHLTVPVFGRVQREPVPSGGGYAITPMNPPGSYTFPRVFTTGLWTEGLASHSGATVNYDFSGATSLSGANGRPDPTLGDHALVVDFITDGASGCRIGMGSAALGSSGIQAGTYTTQTPTWDSGRKPVMSNPVDPRFITRLATGLGKLISVSTFNAGFSSILFGAAASTDMPGLTATPDISLQGTLLPIPVMQTLLKCPWDATLPQTAQPMMLDSFPHVLHVQLVITRQVLGVSLNSGMETVLTSAATGGFTMAFPAAIPTMIKLATPANGTVDLADNTDQIAIGSPSDVFELTFQPEMAADLRADYFDVLLHRITGGVLTTERIYTVTAPKVRIEGSVLVPGADYVFEVRSYKGHPKAQHGDFSAVDYPYGAAIVFTRTFKVS